jgi:hypothetical protein
MIEKDFAEHFVTDWIDSWNKHDLVRILSHYTPRCCEAGSEGVCGNECSATSLLPTIMAQRRQGSESGHSEIGGQYAARLGDVY